MTDNNQDARHPASQIRLLQAYRDGDFARSQELSSAIQLFVGSCATYFLVKTMVAKFAEFSAEIWSQSQISFGSVEQFNAQIVNATRSVGLIVLPLLIVLLLVSIASHVWQNTTFSFFNKSILELERLNPINGLKRIFSGKNFFRAVLGIPKIVILATVFGSTIWQLRYRFANLALQSTGDMVSQMFDCIFIVMIACTATLLAMSVLDYIIERFSFAKRHAMTDQQLRDENRMQESNPQLGNRRQQFYQDVYR